VLPRTEAEANLKRLTGRDIRKQRFERMPGLEIVPNDDSALRTGKLSFNNAHTGDFINIRYFNEQGKLDGPACRELSHFFRCHMTGRETRINPRLFLLLDAVRNGLGAGEEPFLLFSGYRSPAYNRLLARRDGHVARSSFHMRGMAADVALPGVPLADLERLARSLGIGGVGRYGKFVHLDIGPVRYW
jgi:uncharacterized protein YcbK (DUF882 family)